MGGRDKRGGQCARLRTFAHLKVPTSLAAEAQQILSSLISASLGAPTFTAIAARGDNRDGACPAQDWQGRLVTRVGRGRGAWRQNMASPPAVGLRASAGR